MRHECIIGVLWSYESTSLVTLGGLLKHIKEKKELNRMISSDPLYSKISDLTVKEWSLAQYADKRVNTDLHRFYFCPECGKKIDWKKIKEDAE